MLMVKGKRASMFKWLWLSGIVIVLDQWSKIYMVSWLTLYEQFPVIPHFNFTMAHNTGAAFSFLADAGGVQHWFFLAVAIGMSIILLVWLKKLNPSDKLEAFSISMILGGAIGNVTDRFNYGYVIDFLQFYAGFLKPILGSPYFPAFNLADSAIFLGAVLLIVDSFRTKTVV